MRGCSGLRSVLAMAAGLGLASAAAAFPRPTAPDPQQFVLMAWDEVRAAPADLEGMRDAGLNVAGFCTAEQVEAVRRAGLACILRDPRLSQYDWSQPPAAAVLESDVARAVPVLAARKTVLGVLLNDEPQSRDLAAIGRVAASLERAVPGTLPFVNLFPYREFRNDWYDDYEAYVRGLIDTVHPGVVSFDNYALTHAGMGDEFFSNLAIVRRVALEKHLPFWACLQSVAHFGYRVPSDETLHLQVWSALAHGARGIEYFTYYTPERGNYRLAAIDGFGHRTATWEALRRINLEVQALAPTLSRLTSVGVYHYPDTPRQGEPLSASPLVRAISLAKDEDEFVPPAVAGRILTGEFVDAAGRTYLMIVNKDLSYSFKFEIEFRRPVTVLHRINPYTGAEEPFEGEQNWLAPGGGVLLRVD